MKRLSLIIIGFILIGFSIYFAVLAFNPQGHEQDEETNEYENGKEQTITYSNPHFDPGATRESVTKDLLEDNSNKDALLSPCLSKLSQEEKEIFQNYPFQYGLNQRGIISPRYQNIHLLDESGDIMRLRFFYQDGQNGDILKMTLYRENDEEFPELLEENEARDFLKKRGEFENWLNKSEILYIEEGITLTPKTPQETPQEAPSENPHEVFAIVEKNSRTGENFNLTRLDVDGIACE